ncbi:MAG: 4-(cytidine 5'-diphospho)-2-C-methyl-D-erythritol kinase, partial [Dinoroseobacter sp.]|nr:4-(cytidine 5'-diphospho)-2-C-methyl-D-erythritol kinase [Dinoroseobacter sp.]
MHMVLANPRVGVTTPSVFGRMTNKINPPLEDIPANMDAAQLVHWLSRQRNDLEVPAISGLPVIQDVLNALEDIPSCCLARMSGSGATCFGLFETAAQARLAEDTLRAEHQDWWVASGPMLLD